MQNDNTTIIITTYNQIDILPICLKWLKQVSGIKNILVIDNGSSDGTNEWLAGSGYDYIFFDEGPQGYGILWNAAIANFDIGNNIVFMEPQYFPGQECILRLADLLEKNNNIVNALSNSKYYSYYVPIDDIKQLPYWENLHSGNTSTTLKSLCIDKGFWMLSQKNLSEVGPFSEELVQAKNVLLDYELRAIQKGYQPLICTNAFIYNAQPQQIITDFEKSHNISDRDTLKNKWQMNYFNLKPSLFILPLITESSASPLRILEIGCDLGATLLDIKNHYPNSQLYGLEINKAAVEISKHIANVALGNIEDKVIPFEGTFDYIIFGDVLEHLHDPQGIIRFCREKLTPHGCILANIPNLMHISIIEQLLHGRFEYTDTGLLDRTHIHFFTQYEIENMFRSEGYIIEQIIPSLPKPTLAQENLLEKLMEISTNVTPDMYRAFHYAVKARVST